MGKDYWDVTQWGFLKAFLPNLMKSRSKAGQARGIRKMDHDISAKVNPG
ncbi:unnamed protein product, partial [Adineta ricciae]